VDGSLNELDGEGSMGFVKPSNSLAWKP